MRCYCFARAVYGWLALAVLAFSAETLAQDTEEATRAFNKTVNIHNGEDYEIAATLWGQFIKDYPSDSRVADATHYQGVCQFKQQEYEEAAKTFQTVVENHADFKLLEETYLNLGLAQYNTARAGEAVAYDTAAKTFDTLATKYPDGKHAAAAVYYQADCLYYRDKKKEAAAKYAQVLAEYPDKAAAEDAMFALGVTQTELSQHKEALETFATFEQKFPGNSNLAQVTLWKGESLYALDRYAEAAGAFAAAARPGFDLADYALKRQADALSQQKQYAEAAALYASVPEKFPGSAYTNLCNLEAGKKYYVVDQYAKAREFLEKVLAAGGESAPQAAHFTARSLLKENQPDKALEIVEKHLPAAKQDADKVALLMDQADATFEIPARRGKAVALYAAVADKYPGDAAAPEARYMAAFAAMDQGDYQAALEHAEKFLAAHAGHESEVGVLHVKAESLLLSNQQAEAEALYAQLLKKAPNDRDAEIWKVHRGTALFLQKQYQQTIDALGPVLAEIKTADLVAEAQYRVGCSQAALKQFDDAVKSLEASLAAAPKWSLADDAHLVLAFAYQQTKDLDKAKEHARAVIADFPQSKLLDRAHFRLGECCRLNNELKTAATEYQQVVKDWPNSNLMPQVLYGLGWAQLGLEDYAAAEDAFNKLIDGYPNDTLIPRGQYGRGLARRQLKMHGPAVADLEALLATDPPKTEKSQARHVLGLCQKDLAQYDQAIATFTRLLEEDPDYADAVNVRFDLGWAQNSAKQEKEAAATFAKLAEDFPDHALATDSLCLVGDYEYRQKNYKEAARVYYNAMQKAGKTKLGEEISYKLGWSYYLVDDFDRGQAMFLYQRKTWPEGTLLAEATFMEAECFFKQKKYQEALDLYLTVGTPGNEDMQVLTLLHAGNAAGQLKQWQQSLDLLSKCVEQFPASKYLPQALYEKGWALQKLDKPDEAMPIYQQVIAQTDQEPAARAKFATGAIYFGRGEHADAIINYIDVASNYAIPDLQADALWEAARCYEVIRKIPQAINQYEKLVNQFPQSAKAAQAKTRLEELKKL
ncbi:MAG TPA: tetratricopeptide repeat protein [Thermoguttaceae bacterium]|nr:tetratricopeptide repeat protein [Thermoguttaceae bacterium]